MAAYELFTPNESGQRSVPTCYRGCWHVVGRTFFCRYRHFRFVPAESGLQPEGLRPARGVAASGFRPLRKAVHPLRPATRRRLGGPLPHQQADRPRAHPGPSELSRHDHAITPRYPVLAQVSLSYPGVRGRLPTCYSPVRRSPLRRVTPPEVPARLACVRHAASVRPEPGSNSP